ncbi:MAG: GIY-YIG nuclease family protein [Saprospiraceae bacterium]|nr:GIY-YIG nuclease family protein [Candidatus Vicinibacter proximus]MBL7824939.1 GIY-YIG nuclease family protein [Saprospiraceae bacterium]MCC6841751.1 GIY-YIG nuclease family protein [Saprospiraceae bacterium]HRG33150.1 exonuclease domain-containing protein [Saprospiraceae bacterium]
MTRFAIIDIETTGGQYRSGKITEIAIIVFENGQIVDQFESLVNPECSIPFEITRITGIDSEMVKDAPKFYEIAKRIIEITHDCIFVAHNVEFDYSFIKEEFRTLGYTFSRKKLCTVQLSRKYFPGLRSYALGNLIKHFNIEVKSRHRAYEDAAATLKIFQLLLEANYNDFSFTKYIKGALRATRLPSHLTSDDIDALPEDCGVYYMCDDAGKYVYIGKSINIRERILQHFNEDGFKTIKMRRMVHHIEHVLTGSELMAYLLESAEIKKHSPEINRAQKNKTESYALIKDSAPGGHLRYIIKHKDWLAGNEDAIQLFSNTKNAHNYLDYLIYQYQLCDSVQQAKTEELRPCNKFQLGICHGVCAVKESMASYNERFEAMHSKVNRFFTQNFIFFDRGRNADEQAAFVIENGFCSRTGYLNKEENYSDIEEIKTNLNFYKGNIESNGIILNYLKNNPGLTKKYF